MSVEGTAGVTEVRTLLGASNVHVVEGPASQVRRVARVSLDPANEGKVSEAVLKAYSQPFPQHFKR